MNKFKRDLDEFVGESPRFNEPLKRKILSEMKREERPANRFADFKYTAVLMLLLTVTTIFLVLNLNGSNPDPSDPTGTTEELPVLRDPETVTEIERFTEYTAPQEVFDYKYDGMDIGNGDYYEYPLLIDPAAYLEKEPTRGDVVVYEAELFNGISRTIGRIVALPRETVEVKDGQLYIDDQKLETFYGRAHRRGLSSDEIYNGAIKEILSQSIEAFTLGDDEVYITGDDWFRSHQLIIKIDEIQAEVLGYYVE